MQAIDSFAEKLKILTRDDLQIWSEEIPEKEESEDEKNLNELNYSINGIDLNLIFKMQNQFMTEDFQKGLLDGIKEELKEPKDNTVQTTLKYIENNTKSEEAK